MTRERKKGHDERGERKDNNNTEERGQMVT